MESLLSIRPTGAVSDNGEAQEAGEIEPKAPTMPRTGMGTPAELADEWGLDGEAVRKVLGRCVSSMRAATAT